MTTKRFVIDFLAGIAPAFFVVILPMYLTSLLVPLPYALVALALIVGFGWQFARRRYRPGARSVDWRFGRGGRHAPGPRLSR
jgi:hypothetical protein